MAVHVFKNTVTDSEIIMANNEEDEEVVLITADDETVARGILQQNMNSTDHLNYVGTVEDLQNEDGFYRMEV